MIFRKSFDLFKIQRPLSTNINDTSTINYCLNLVRKYDYENFLCALLVPQPARSTIIALRAFNVEVSKAAVFSNDPKISKMKLGFWNETLDRIYEGNPPKNPVALELSRVVSQHNIKKRNLMRIVKARELQFTQHSFQSLEEMEHYSEETVSPIIYMSLEAAGVKNINADHAASHIGKGQGLTLLLRIAGSGGGSWSLPRDLLQSSGIDQFKGLTPYSSSSKDLVLKIATRAKGHIDKARSLKKSLPSGTSIHLLPAVCTYNYLNRLRDADFDIFDPFLRERDFKLGLSLFFAKLVRNY